VVKDQHEMSRFWIGILLPTLVLWLVPPEVRREMLTFFSGGKKMKKLLFGTLLLALASVFPVMTMAAVDIRIGISLPPLIVFKAPPNVIVLPDTNDVYVVPDIDADLFFWNGWWWRPWEGLWYRSRYYNRGWGYYNAVPNFYFDVDPGWRGYYRDHNWNGHRWNYERIPDRRLLFPVVINGAKNGRQKVYHFGDGVAERKGYGSFFISA